MLNVKGILKEVAQMLCWRSVKSLERGRYDATLAFGWNWKVEKCCNCGSNVNLQECSLFEWQDSTVATGKVVTLVVADKDEGSVSLISGASSMIATLRHPMITSYEKQVRLLKTKIQF